MSSRGLRIDPKAAKPEQIVIQVKGGQTGVKDVRNLRGVLDREKSASTGFYEHNTNKQQYPQLELRTVKELMEGNGIERPTSAATIGETFKKVPESKKKHGEQRELGV